MSHPRMRALGRGLAAFAALGCWGAKASVAYLVWNCFCGLVGRSLPGKANLLGLGLAVPAVCQLSVMCKVWL